MPLHLPCDAVLLIQYKIEMTVSHLSERFTWNSETSCSLFQNHFKDPIYHGLVKNTAEDLLPFQGNRKKEEREGSCFFA